jgi:hypothetical protein
MDSIADLEYATHMSRHVHLRQPPSEKLQNNMDLASRRRQHLRACRAHYQKLHLRGTEANWWTNMDMAKPALAKEPRPSWGSSSLALTLTTPSAAHQRVPGTNGPLTFATAANLTRPQTALPFSDHGSAIPALANLSTLLAQTSNKSWRSE